MMKRTMAWMIVVTMFVACSNDQALSSDDQDQGQDQGLPEGTAALKRDAAVDAPLSMDAYAGANSIACPKASNAAWTCHLPPDHCCVGGYGTPVVGQCTSALCTAHQLDCDGPEDCTSGQKCWSYRYHDPAPLETAHWHLMCSATAPGGELDWVVCHLNADCASVPGTTCKPVQSPSVGAYDLPIPYNVCHA
jgi:hypothetical protein